MNDRVPLLLAVFFLTFAAACGSSEREPCETRGDTRCADTQRREICTAAGWMSLDSCASSETCEAGVCQFVVTNETRCDDAVDQDGDGATDCDDDDCAEAAVCRPEQTCDDGVDEDGDGATDCDDDDCAEDAVCQVEQICDDGLDDDGDGAIDCADLDCREDDACIPACAEERVLPVGERVFSGTTLGAGNDHTSTCAADGVDGEDAAALWTAPAAGLWRIELMSGPDGAVLEVLDASDCAAAPLACPELDETGRVRIYRTLERHASVVVVVDGPPGGFEVQMELLDEAASCADGLDDDEDGRTDCDDPDCAPVCLPEACENDIDDDGDEAVDCADLDCAGHSACGGTADVSIGTATGSEVLTGTLPENGAPAAACGGEDHGLRVAWTAAAPGDYLFEAEVAGTPVLSLEGTEVCSASGPTASFRRAAAAGETLILEIDADTASDPEQRAFTLSVTVEQLYEVCNEDRIDEDGDGLADCEDPDCIGTAFCRN